MDTLRDTWQTKLSDLPALTYGAVEALPHAPDLERPRSARLR